MKVERKTGAKSLERVSLVSGETCLFGRIITIMARLGSGLGAPTLRLRLDPTRSIAWRA